ncbi:DUF3526 domain-containing protein [Novosphingobium sp. AP12]|uniref:DUF3526 domain-containing protein n=1 Tax=Novosphingobium sp. AP12 TaxID=1144305 RepID=UPI000271F1AA|nr:DUF3526 domain-containing protein [Novosphingobium sp. AP12]EJL24217.1 Protein of unknown function (DUF3526) [Novosphingobium sp. AP12]
MKTLGLELKMMLRGGRTVAAAAVFALVMVLSGVSSYYGNLQGDREKNQVAHAERERWLHQSGKDAHQAAHYSIYAFRPGAPMHTLDPGILPFVGQAVWLEPHWQNDMIYRPLQEAEPFQRMGIADPARFLVEFGPLLVFLVAFGATAADRETGIMRLALGAARRPAPYVWGKWGAVTLFSSATLLLPSLLIGLGALATAPSVDGLMRLLAWLGTFSVYFATLAAIGVVVCLNARTARLGFAVLLGLWAVLAFVAPRAASSAANQITPLPSYAEVKLEMEREAPIYWSAQTGEAQTRIIMKRYGVARREDLPVDLRGALIDYNERRSHGVFDRILGGFYRRVAEQDRTFAAQAWMSPAVGAQALSGALAGSDFAHQLDFITSAERYRRNLVNRMNGLLLTAQSKSSTYKVNGITAGDDDFRKVPEFTYAGPSIALAFASIGSALAYLLVWLGGGLALLAWTTRRIHP